MGCPRGTAWGSYVVAVAGGGQLALSVACVCGSALASSAIPPPPPILTGTAGRHNPPPPHLPQGFGRPADPVSVLKGRGELGAQVFTGFAHPWSALATPPPPPKRQERGQARGACWGATVVRWTRAGLQMQEGQPGGACEQAGQFCGGTSAGPAAGRPLAWVWKSRCRAKGPSVVFEHRWHTVALNDTSEKGTSRRVAPEARGSGQPWPDWLGCAR